MLSDGLFLRSLVVFLPKIVPRTLETECTPSFLRIGNARSSWTDLASRRSAWNANAAPAGLSAALTS
jgi:hypothetical protein